MSVVLGCLCCKWHIQQSPSRFCVWLVDGVQQCEFPDTPFLVALLCSVSLVFMFLLAELAETSSNCVQLLDFIRMLTYIVELWRVVRNLGLAPARALVPLKFPHHCRKIIYQYPERACAHSMHVVVECQTMIAPESPQDRAHKPSLVTRLPGQAAFGVEISTWYKKKVKINKNKNKQTKVPYEMINAVIVVFHSWLLSHQTIDIYSLFTLQAWMSTGPNCDEANSDNFFKIRRGATYKFGFISCGTRNTSCHLW